MRHIIMLTAAKEADENNLPLIRIPQNYVNAIAEAGGMPIVPVFACDELQKFVLEANGLLLSGGRDVSAERYGKTNEKCSPVDQWRDELEFFLLSEFVKAGKPVFGICRGIQVINIYFGGDLWQDLTSELGTQHRDVVHPVTISEGSYLERLFGNKIEVNSFHHQAIKNLGNDLEPLAYSPQNFVEAIKHKYLPIYGVQWHPERMTGWDRMTQKGPDMKVLFEEWMKQC